MFNSVAKVNLALTRELDPFTLITCPSIPNVAIYGFAFTSKLSIFRRSQTLDNTPILHVLYRETSSRKSPPYFMIIGLNSQYTWDV